MTTKSIHKDPLLEALFTSRARIEVLKLFFLRSSGRHYVREIAALTDQPVRAVQRELARLEQTGLLVSTVEGNRKYFQANRNALIFMDLRSLLAKTAGFAEAFRERLQKKAASIDAAFIFGSFAQGTETTESDIDLLVIGRLSGRELSRMLAPLKNELGREINPITITPDEFVERVEQKEPFILSVIEEPKIYILGGGDELAALPG